METRQKAPDIMKGELTGVRELAVLAAMEKVDSLDLERVSDKVRHGREFRQFAPEVADQILDRLVSGYRQFLALKIAYPELSIVPTEGVDLIWHGHILDTQAYAKDSETMGTFIDHNPYFGQGDDISEFSSAVANTQALSYYHFGEDAYTEDGFLAQEFLDPAYCSGGNPPPSATLVASISMSGCSG